ncbi:MAG: nickel pincer cofactor biosynthesis protein LarB [Methanomicrobiaceae archaeon]|uniref:Circadian phase modifier n=1 Tax=hydrocarbon metagenome TaxID=938273 RepID=A0A0W8FJJ4_9ZZZZ|nr:nickel pincer cofactor biosynthesis protein LarB [Methanomicrobiaceae archaeon]MDD5418832.1 nickel pincer cofactor biosynthesis protein LarB [Methanomicrobiaceae archaeon]
MSPNAALRDVLQRYCRREITEDEALQTIEGLRIEIVGDMARIDAGRGVRCGMPEVVLAEGKTPELLADIMIAQLATAGRCIATRASPEHAAAVRARVQQTGITFEYREAARALILSTAPPPQPRGGVVGILTAGTTDIPVAEEARLIAEEMGCEVRTAFDVGVAGIHRLFPALRHLLDAHVLIVAAGREGTLPTIVAGLVDRPVIGLPVSTGYGHMGNGEAALASMLQSCAVLGTVNIDAGFVAGALAARIANMAAGGGRE